MLANTMRVRMERTEERFYLSPLRFFVSEQVAKWRKTFIDGLLADANKRPNKDLIPSTFWRNAVEVVGLLSRR